MATNEWLVVRTRGVAELVRAADAAGGQVKKGVRDALRESAVPVRDTVKQLLADNGVSSRTVSGVGISVRRAGTVSVEQRRRKTTGKHPAFGSYQMREAFMPGLEQHAAEAEQRLEEAVDRACDTFERRG